MAATYDRIIRLPLKRLPAGVADCPNEERCQLEVVRPDTSQAIEIVTADDGTKTVRIGLIKEGGGCDFKVRVGMLKDGPTEYLRTFIYLYGIGAYELIFDLGAGKPLNMGTFVGLPGSPPAPATNPCFRDAAWLAWYVHNFEYSNQDITVPMSAVKAQPDNAPENWSGQTTVASTITPMGSACTQTAHVIKESVYTNDPATYQREVIDQSGTFNYDCPVQLANQDASTVFNLWSANSVASAAHSKDFGYGYDVYDEVLGALAGKIRFTLDSVTTVTVHPHSTSYPYSFVDQSKAFAYGTNVFGLYSYSDSDSFDWTFRATGADEYKGIGTFVNLSSVFGEATSLWNPVHAEGERFFVFVGGTYQRYQIFDMSDCNGAVGCDDPGCWSVYMGGNYSAFGNMYSVLSPASYWPGVCEYKFVMENKIAPAVAVTRYSDVAGLVVGQPTSSTALINAASAAKSEALGAAIANLVETTQAAQPTAAVNIHTTGPGWFRLCKIKGS